MNSMQVQAIQNLKKIISTTLKYKDRWVLESGHGVTSSYTQRKDLMYNEYIPFDCKFWEDKFLPKLVPFYDNCVAPVLVHFIDWECHFVICQTRIIIIIIVILLSLMFCSDFRKTLARFFKI